MTSKCRIKFTPSVRGSYTFSDDLVGREVEATLVCGGAFVKHSEFVQLGLSPMELGIHDDDYSWAVWWEEFIVVNN